MQACSSSGVPEWDAAYARSSYNTPMDVLYMLVVFLASLLSVFGMLLIVLYYLNYFSADTVSYTLVFGGALLSFNSLLPYIINVLTIVYNDCFHIGDIVTFCSPYNYTSSPPKTVTGFVESLTLTHVVVRDFVNKQNWLPHTDAVRMVVINWSRRPTYTIRMWLSLSATAPADGVKALVRFMRRWIDDCPCVNPHGYKKSCIASVAAGYQVLSSRAPV